MEITPNHTYSFDELIEKVKKLDFDNDVIYSLNDRQVLSKILEYLYSYDEIINIEENPEKYNLTYFYYLSILIETEKDIINFNYSHQLIIDAYDFLFGKTYIKEGIIREILAVKIIYILIDNYKSANDFDDKIKEKINEIEKSIQNIYKNILKNNDDLIKNFHLPEGIYDIDIQGIYKKTILDFFDNHKFEDYEILHNTFSSIEADSNGNKEIVNTIKSITASKKFQDEYLLTKDDFHNTEKINCLYIIWNYIIKVNSDIENFQFLLNTKLVLEELLVINNKNGKEYLLKNIDKGSQKRFEKIIKSFEDNEKAFSENIPTETQTVEYMRVIRVDKDNEVSEFSDGIKINYNKYCAFEIPVPDENQGYNINSLKVYEGINRPSFKFKSIKEIMEEKSNISEYLLDYYEYNSIISYQESNDYILRKFNSEIDKNRIKDFIKVFNEMQNDFIKNIELKTLIDKEEGKIKIALLNGNKVYLHLFEVKNCDDLDEIINFHSDKRINSIYFE
jgi:hypothetical protein